MGTRYHVRRAVADRHAQSQANVRLTVAREGRRMEKGLAEEPICVPYCAPSPIPASAIFVKYLIIRLPRSHPPGQSATRAFLQGRRVASW